MTAFPWENLTIGLGWMYDVVPGNMSIELLHSYDGIDWRREGPRRPWVADDCPSGLSSHMYVTASNPPHVLDKEMWFYVSGANRNHHQVSSATPSQMRLLSMPLNRWVSYGTHGEHPGLLLSAPLAWRGGRLALNAAIDPDGYIKTSICDLRGNELPDYDLDKINLLQGPVDEVEQPVRYWGDLDKRYFSLPDQGPVRLKFTLYKARLYGWTLL